MQKGISLISIVIMGVVLLILVAVVSKGLIGRLDLSALHPYLAVLPGGSQLESGISKLDDQTNWQTFVDNKNILNFKLPKDSLVLSKQENKGEQLINFQNPAFDLTLKVKTASVSSSLQKAPQSNVIINGVNWVKTNLNPNIVEYATTKDNKTIIFTFRLPNPQTNLPQNILSTFNFRK